VTIVVWLLGAGLALAALTRGDAVATLVAALSRTMVGLIRVASGQTPVRVRAPS